MLHRFGRGYPTYWHDDGTGGHCLVRAEWLGRDGAVLATSDFEQRSRYLEFVGRYRAPRFAEHWTYLLKPIVPDHSDEKGLIRFRQIEYSRMPVLAYLAMDNARELSRADFVRLGLVTGAGAVDDEAPYSSRYLRDFEERYYYDQFWNDDRPGRPGTRLMSCGHAFVMVGDAGDPFFIDRENGLLGQFRHQYFLLFLIPHFHEVSDQPQAKELYRMTSNYLGSDRLYDEIHQELGDMANYLESDTLRRQANTVVRLTVVTAFGLVGTIVTGFLGMNLLALAESTLWEKAGYFVLVLVPTTVLTFYTIVKSKRLSDFLEALSDERLPASAKFKSLLDVWKK